MFDLTKQEKVILIFLTLTFLTGLGVNSYKKARQGSNLSVATFKMEAARERADSFIEEQRFVNINSFNIDELTRLPGVGEMLAQRIIDYHKLHGPFRRKEELLQIKGIGKKKFAQLKNLITLE